MPVSSFRKLLNFQGHLRRAVSNFKSALQQSPDCLDTCEEVKSVQHASNFSANLIKTLTDSVTENHAENVDIIQGKILGKPSVRETISGDFEVNRVNSDELKTWAPLFRKLDWLHDQLEDSASRNLLVKLVAYRLMGYQAIKLPTNNPEYRRLEGTWSSRGRTTNIKSDVGGMVFDLKEFDLAPEGQEKSNPTAYSDIIHPRDSKSSAML